ncbi:ricin-type beta-trefoil lectin domain protein [Streptomyces sp. NPDC086835]|uniref:ricin-type beta-trefoil lectin domain protein n=1 Tax=Streptomyces sp. NPDC086835 TaxID=3365761 RepID=UPI00382F5F37
MSDTDLVRLIRRGGPAAALESPATSVTAPTAADGTGATPQPTAWDELRRRHYTAVLAYARLCALDLPSAGLLAEAALQHVLTAIQDTLGPEGVGRHQQLIVVAETAIAWAGDGRRAELAPDFLAWLDKTEREQHARISQPAEDTALITQAFSTLLEPRQAVLWHAIVEQDDAEAGIVLGVAASTVPTLAATALEAFLEAYVRDYPGEDGDECRRFSGLVKAMVRCSGARHNDDLDRHLGDCWRCSRAAGDLAALEKRPAVTLAEGLLPWGGSTYLSARGPAAAPASPGPGPQPSRLSSLAARRRTPPGRGRFTVAAIAAMSVATAGASAAVVTTSSSTEDGSPAPPVMISRPTAYVTATLSSTPTPSPSASASRSATAPTPSLTPPAPSGCSTIDTSRNRCGDASKAPSSEPPSPPVPESVYTELINANSGKCLDVRDQNVQRGTDVVVQSCTGAPSQKWNTGTSGLIRNLADRNFCLDSRGSVERGVGVWNCSGPDGAEGPHGVNLRFQFADDGSVRPFIDRNFAIIEGPDSRAQLGSVDGSSGQLWRIGRTTVVPD